MDRVRGAILIVFGLLALFHGLRTRRSAAYCRRARQNELIAR